MLSRFHVPKHTELKLGFQTATGQDSFTFTLTVAFLYPTGLNYMPY